MALNTNNIIVYGVRRSGTSLMMQILSAIDNYSIDFNELQFNSENYKNLQEFYNEGKFVAGINKDNFLDYSLTKNKVIKFMEQGLIKTPIKFINDMKLIIVMNRYWCDHVKSLKKLEKINFESILISNEEIKKRIPESEYDKFFNEYYLYPDGLEYGIYMSDTLLNIFNRKFFDKIIIVEFNDLINNFDKIKNLLFQKKLIDISKGKKFIKESTTKFRNSTKSELKEFTPGFFDFLNLLYNKIKLGIIDNELLDEISKWYPLMKEMVELRMKKIKDDYNIIIK